MFAPTPAALLPPPDLLCSRRLPPTSLLFASAARGKTSPVSIPAALLPPLTSCVPYGHLLQASSLRAPPGASHLQSLYQPPASLPGATWRSLPAHSPATSSMSYSLHARALSAPTLCEVFVAVPPLPPAANQHLTCAVNPSLVSSARGAVDPNSNSIHPAVSLTSRLLRGASSCRGCDFKAPPARELDFKAPLAVYTLPAQY